MVNKYYEKFVADNDEYEELSVYDDCLYGGEVTKELLEDEDNGVLIIKPCDDDDYRALCDWLEESSYVAQETKNGEFIFYQDKDLIDHLENELYQIFEELNINVTIK